MKRWTLFLTLSLQKGTKALVPGIEDASFVSFCCSNCEPTNPYLTYNANSYGVLSSFPLPSLLVERWCISYHITYSTIASLFSESSLDSTPNSDHLSTLKRPSSYYLTCNGYSPNCAFYHCYYGQHPPPYSQPFFPPLFLPKRHLPLHVSQQPHIFSEPPSSIRRGQSSLRVQRHTSHLHTRTTTLKRRRTSTGQPPAFPISAALSSIQPTEDTHTHDWRSGYKPPSQSSYFRRHFESFLVPCNLTSNMTQSFFSFFFFTSHILWSLNSSFLVSGTLLYIVTFTAESPAGGGTGRSP